MGTSLQKVQAAVGVPVLKETGISFLYHRLSHFLSLFHFQLHASVDDLNVLVMTMTQRAQRLQASIERKRQDLRDHETM